MHPEKAYSERPAAHTYSETNSRRFVMTEKIDLTGQPFGRLIVIREAGRAKDGHVLWLCRCECGNEIVVTSGHLRDEHTQSCGCLRRELNTTHGCRHKTWYKVYCSMMARCGHFKGESERKLNNYRDRGITVCDLWQKSPLDFGDWLLSHGWHKGLQIDRIDNNQGYSPENCRVVTPKENINNRRNTCRLGDGTPLAMFCSSLGIDTRKGKDATKKYIRILMMLKRRHKIHPELMQALKDDTEKQSRLLEITKLKIRHAELMLAGLKEILVSKQTA